jgi:hypothetical protein
MLTRFALALVPFLCTIAVVLIWHALCRDLAGPRFAIWSTALIACHGPFLLQVQSATPTLLILLLALCALWGFISHVRSVDSVLSVQTLIGGVSLGLCLLVSGLAAITVVAVAVLLSVALRMDTAKADNNGNGETRAQLRGRWTALKSVGVMALTAFAVGGWWVMMIAAKHGPQFWVHWLGFDQIAAAREAARNSGGATESAAMAFFRLIDHLGMLFVPALYGVWYIGRGLVWQREKLRRFPLQFLAAWLICGFTIWGIRLRVLSNYGDAWDLFIMLPLVGCAALTVEQIVSRSMRTVVAVWLVCLAVALPLWADVYRSTSQSGLFHVFWGGTFSLVSYLSAFAILTAWLLMNARRHDDRQQFCLIGLLIMLGVANAVHGLQGVCLEENDRRSTNSLVEFHEAPSKPGCGRTLHLKTSGAVSQQRVLTEFHASLLDLENADAQILITDEAAPPYVEFAIRAARPGLSLETMHDWNDGVARASEIVSETNQPVFIVDWRSLNARTSTSPEHNLNVERQFAPKLFRGRRLTAFLLTQRKEPK